MKLEVIKCGFTIFLIFAFFLLFGFDAIAKFLDDETIILETSGC